MKKNYLKIFLMVFAISLIADNLFAQGAYININAGYGFIMGSGTGENYTSNPNKYTYDAVNFSFGKGLNVCGAFGFMFNKNVGAELGISYLLGGKTKFKEEYTSTGSYETIDITESSNMLRINPSFVIASGIEKFNPYAKFGMIIGVGSFTTKEDHNDNGDITVEKWKYTGGIGIGLSSGIGIIFNISDKTSLFGELNMINLSYAPSKGKMTEYTQNGVDKLPALTTKQKEIEFDNSYTTDSSSPIPNSEPDKGLKSKAPCGSFGINFGLKIGLSK
jgi:hypothetical protein